MTLGQIRKGVQGCSWKVEEQIDESTEGARFQYLGLSWLGNRSNVTHTGHEQPSCSSSQNQWNGPLLTRGVDRTRKLENQKRSEVVMGCSSDLQDKWCLEADSWQGCLRGVSVDAVPPSNPSCAPMPCKAP